MDSVRPNRYSRFMNISFKSLILVSVAALSIPQAQAFEMESVYLQYNEHVERRSNTLRYNRDGNVGIDFGFLGFFYVGPRFGMIRMSVQNIPTIDVETKLSGGLHAYGLLPLGLFSLKGGLAADLVAGDEEDPVYLYVGAEAGLRLGLGLPVYVEFPVEVGVFPDFNDRIILYRFGLQAGVEF